MFWNMESLRGYKIRATDDSLGQVHDFLFDDATWTVRYLVVDTAWIFGRRVLISASALGEPDVGTREFPVSLTKQQVKDSPDIDTDQPVSRQQEAELHSYYGWVPYWGAGTAGLATPAPAETMVDPLAKSPAAGATERGDPHLRSEREVNGYAIHANDGTIGDVEDFIVDDADWKIRYLVVDTGNWLPGRKVVISPDWVREIRWAKREVAVTATREQIRSSPEYDPNVGMDRDYERRLYGHHGQTVYWE